MHFKSGSIAVAIGMFAALTPAAQAVVFDFGPYAPTNATVPLSIAAGSLAAAFSSPSGEGAFIAEDGSPFSTLGAAALADDNFAPEELDIAFSSAVREVAFAFATDDPGPPTAITLTAMNGASVVGTEVVTGVLQASGLPEGVIDFIGQPFTSVAITDPDSLGFAIGAVTANVPEPSGALALVGAGLLLLLAARRAA